MRPKFKRLQGKAAGWLLARTQKWLRRSSYPKALARGEAIGRFLWRVAGRRRRTGESNLEMALGIRDESERRALCKRVFENFGRTAADFLIGLDRTYSELMDTTTVSGQEHLVNALERGKGVIVVTGHFGNWERVSTWVVNQGYKLSVIARDANDEGVNEIVNRLRRGPGTSVIPRGNAARPMIERLRQNEVIGILPDQNSDEVFIPFFGKPAGTVLGPGVIAERTGAVVLPAFCRYVGGGKYAIEFLPEITSPSEYETKGEGMMRAINAVLEDYIRQYPDQWLWFHDRWRNARRRGLL